MSAKYLLSFESHLSSLNMMVTEVGDGQYTLIPLTDCEIKLEVLESMWNKLSDAHDKLTGCKDIDMSHNYFKEGRYSKALSRYVLVKSALKRRVVELEPRPAPLSPHNLSLHAQATTARPLLPTIQPPTFNGELLEWQSFKNKFASVVNKEGVSEVDKMHYLLQSLKGTAYSLVANVEISKTAFATAWQTLNTRYENKRVLITAQLNKLFNIPQMASRASKEVNNVINTVSEVMNALAALGSPVEHWDHFVVHFITQKLDPTTREDWELTLGAASEFPTYERIKTFLLSRARALEAMEGRLPVKPRDPKANKRASSNNKPPHGFKNSPAHVHVANSQQSVTTTSGSSTNANSPPGPSPGPATRHQNPCSCCGEAHFIVSCPLYRNLTPNERHQRAISKSLCLNCLGTHALENCRSKNRCRHCNAAHHSMLHDSTHLYAPPAKSNAPTTLSSRFQGSQTNATPRLQRTLSPTSTAASLLSTQQSLSSYHSSSPERPLVLLATAYAFLITPTQRPHAVRLLIDPGSELSLISQHVTRLLNLSSSESRIPIIGVGSVPSGSTKGAVNILLRSAHSDDQVTLHAHVLPHLTVELPPVDVSSQSWPHIADLELADPNYASPGRIDILVGADSYGVIMKPGIRTGSPGQPIAIQTIFGWAVLGPINSTTLASPAHQGLLVTNSQLHDLIARFWELEDVSSSGKESLSAEEAECEAHYMATHSRDISGRYIVRLPFKSNAPPLGHSKSIAQRALTRLLKLISTQPELQHLYHEFLDEYESLGHMQKGKPSNAEADSYYLPHHGVMRNNKIRVVFNGSCKSTSGNSLNDCLHVGPKTQNDIFDVLLYVRRHQLIFTTDVEKMFRQILVHPEDQKFQRILWINENNQVQDFDLCTVTYGTTSAPYLAGRTLQQLLLDEGHDFPVAVEPFQKGSYVDDITGGADDIKSLNAIATQVEEMALRGCFPLAKWKSNHPGFFRLPSFQSTSSETHQFSESSSKILGLAWQCAPDLLMFTGQPILQATITKRTILSETAQLFDPLGLISPIIVRAKVLMQDLWQEKIGWDDTLPPQIIHPWTTFRNELAQLSQLTIPRWLQLRSDNSQVEIHGFSDASLAAMAAAVYVKVSSPSGSSTVTLVCSKTRVAPLHRLTIPRLELSAALLLSKLITRVQTTLQLQHAPVTLWTDSSVSLAWINSDALRWKEFVKNRVQQIQQSAPDATWRFVSGKHNPADCASRGLTPSQLITHKLWWSGPDWLAEPNHLWPSFAAPNELPDDMEIRPSTVHVSSTPQLPFGVLFRQDTTLTKLLRVTATIQRAAACFRRVPSSGLKSSPLNPADLRFALTFWIKSTQQSYFASELQAISQGKSLAKSHPLTRLTAWIDQTGLLRVGGRLQNAQLDEDAKHPPILPKDSILSHLIISNAHTRTLHGGTQLTLNYLRKYCWILGGRAPVKSHIHRCVTCTRIRGARAQQRMGQLPASRVTPSLVFEHSGVDYAGPVSLKFFNGRGSRTYKAWIAVFVCFSTSAVHLELVTDYSAEGFLKAFRRFVSRRGVCKTLSSDCGTNFQGAQVELKSLLAGFTKESQHLQQLIANDGTHWKFNPPGAPHMGGKWEAAVKSVKQHLAKINSDKLLTYEDYTTLLIQIEAVLNSRPLSALSEDPDDLTALTPGHFIRGAPLTTIPEPSLLHLPINRLSLLQYIQQRLQLFWANWSESCLKTHQTISKWNTSFHDIGIGSMVLLLDERFPPSKWPLGRVTHVHPGQDDLTRVVTVKTATSTYLRPIHKLVLLPIPRHEEDSHDAPPATSQVLRLQAAKGGEKPPASRYIIDRRTLTVYRPMLLIDRQFLERR
ncbi:uncharacterized protein LOC128668657 [Microplitis demolitor]|uniref:uncharacterized protein LOC128668657 n=1 Tax=Microplitis demolitor TaxID=69319 RepID=UPI00235B5C3E|nr:uncharacterized protein LOC128668657 [Microplitis demolitor]